MKHSVSVFFAWHGLESCWRLGVVEPDHKALFFMGSNLAGVRVLWNWTKALFFMGSKSHVRHSFGVFFAWHGLGSCWRSVVSEPKLCFLWVPKVTWSILSACFLHGMGSNLAGVSVLSNLTLTRLWAAIVRNPRFERFFAWQRLDCCWRSGVSEPKLCFLWVPKVTWSILSACFLLGMGSNLAGVSVFSNLTLTRLWAAIVRNPRFERFFAWQRLDCCWRSGVSERSFVFYGFQRWREAFCLRVFCLAWARILLVFRSFRIWRWRDFEQPSFGIHVSNGFLLGRGSTAAGVRVFRNRSFVFYGFQRWREAFCRRVFCLAWARILLVFRSFRIWRWRDLEQPSFGIHVPACGYMCVSNGFLLGRGSTAAGVRVFRNRSFVFYGFQTWREAFCLGVFCLAWARILLVFRSFRIWRWRDFE